jgi:hypothetical protein
LAWGASRRLRQGQAELMLDIQKKTLKLFGVALEPRPAEDETKTTPK